MPQMTKRTSRSAVLLLAIIGVLAFGAFGNRPTPTLAPVQPPLTVWIDFKRVFEAAPFVAEQELALSAVWDDFQAMLQELEDDIRRLNGELRDVYQPGSEEYARAEAKLTDLTIEKQAQVDFVHTKIAADWAMTMKYMFERVQGQSKAFATANGYHYVLISDAGFDLPIGTEDQMKMNISSRRIIYADPQYDVTEGFVAWLKAHP